MNKPVLVTVLALFSALTLYALAEVGLWNLFVHNLNHPAGMQIFADLGIALGLFCGWMWRDARSQERNPWLWTLFVFTVGSFGPLLYLITRKQATA